MHSDELIDPVHQAGLDTHRWHDVLCPETHAGQRRADGLTMGACRFPVSLPMNTSSSQARCFLVLGGLNLALAVALGAAGTHALKASLAANDPAGWFRTALDYHQLHALGLIAVGVALAQSPACRWFAWAGWLLLAGIALFSGNLYLRSIAGIHDLHAVTPFGGGAFILAWLNFAVGALTRDDGRGGTGGG